ncbi:MAG TPA: hypothetical protein VMG12_11055 [Polyangiaceae bacterium]|nr:hypothetical protein [Polyangiaceae bacterium]
MTCIVLPSCGGEEDTSITYSDDVRPIFNQRCTTCHYSSTPIGVDIQNPFSAERGLVNSKNSWAIEAPGLTDEDNVVPGDPDSSFLIDKLTGNLPDDGKGGSPMPYQVPPLDEEQIGILEQWVTDGAKDDAFFAQNVRPIFGSEDTAGNYYRGRCIYCHYDGSPNPLNLSKPFDPVEGLVNVPARYRGDMVRVLPGNPEESLLILKVRAQRPEGDIGAQMPYSYPALTDRQIDVVRQWIAEGARP